MTDEYSDEERGANKEKWSQRDEGMVVKERTGDEEIGDMERTTVRRRRKENRERER